METRHVLLTGGLGFIGSHLADAFLAAGCRVTIIDSGVASITDGARYARHSSCLLVRQSIEEFFGAGGTFTGVDRVIHTASPVGPARILSDVGRLGSEMARTAQQVIDACIHDDIPLCVFSSAEVYNRSGSLAETDDIRVPVHYNARIEYAIAKVLVEAMTVNSAHRGLRAIVVRPFNVAGPGQSRTGGFVLPTFVQQALAGEPLTVFSTGEQVRAFLAVNDLVRFLVEFMDAALQKRDTLIYNLGNPANATTVRRLAELVRSLAGSTSDVIYVDGRTVHGPLYAEAESTEKVPILGGAADLGWRPLVSLRELILQTIDYYRKQVDVQDGYVSHQRSQACTRGSPARR